MQLSVNILVSFIFILAYFYFFLSFFFERKSVFVLLLLTFIVFYDFVFINISPYVSPAVFYFIKSWQEYLLLFLLLLTVFSGFRKGFFLTLFDKRFLSTILLVTIIGIVVSVANGIAVNQVFLGWRMYVLPLLWCFFLYKTGVFKKISSTLLINFILTLAVIVVAVAAYQDYHFQGGLRSSLWFYDFIDKMNPIEEHEFDFIRDEQLRATGVFVSPLIYATFLSFAMLLILFKILLKRTRISFISSGILMAVILYGQFLSRTRIGFIILAIGCCCSILAYQRPGSKLYQSLLIPLAFLTVTFISLLLGTTDDLSALGRLIQYASLPSNFVFAGMGFGAEMTSVYFDSFYISAILLFGIFVPFYFYLFILLYKKMHAQTQYIKNVDNDPYLKVLFCTAYGYGFSFVYTFGFHFTTGSATVQLFFLLMFLVISKLENVKLNHVGQLATS